MSSVESSRPEPFKITQRLPKEGTLFNRVPQRDSRYFIPESELYEDENPQALLVITPPAPTEQNPPLAPAVLAKEVRKMNIDYPDFTHARRIRVSDWNIQYIREYGGSSASKETTIVGDHGKNRDRVGEAMRHFFEQTGLLGRPTLYETDSGNPVAGMHYSFDQIQDAIAEAGKSHDWLGWIEDVLSEIDNNPPVLGASVMGPAQVFGTLFLFDTAKRIWPNVVTVMGGSHATILVEEMKKDPRYTHNRDGKRIVDAVLPGHSEFEFQSLIQEVVDTKRRNSMEEVWDNLPRIIDTSLRKEFDYYPLFSKSQLDLYDRETLTLPLQFTRGCVYNKCTFCTYPVVEPVPTHRSEFNPELAQQTIANLSDVHGVKRFSIKDSLFSHYWLEALADELLKKGPENIVWSATTKITPVLKRLAPKLARAGCTTLEFGIERIDKKGLELFHKLQPRKEVIEDTIMACVEQGINVVVNLIFGLPGETLEEAQAQLAWFQQLQKRAEESNTPGKIKGSFNLLEITRGSPLEIKHPTDVVLEGVAPWASAYRWNAPVWRGEFSQELAKAQ